MAAPSTPAPPAALTSITSTEAKNTFGAVLERVLVEGGVAITKHDEIKAVLLSVREYEALVAARRDPLEELAGEFDSVIARMQGRSARKAGKALFDASPKALGKAAVAGARRRG